MRSSIPASIDIHEKVGSTAWVMADPTQVHQVVMNLGTNAYHAMRDAGGTLTIELEDVVLTRTEIRTGGHEAVPGPHVRLGMEDTGHGMDEVTLNKIFDPYFTTKKPGKGTGMGLSVVDGIIKQHGGFIRASSEPDRGTRFEVFWPATDPGDAGQGADSEISEAQEGCGHILVVDDETEILKAMRALLSNQGYTVTVKESPLEALALFEKSPRIFDLLITDMTMPKMTGDRLSKKVLAIRPDMPIILCTGYHETMSEQAAIDIGIGIFLEKPILPRDLYAAVTSLIDH